MQRNFSALWFFVLPQHTKIRAEGHVTMGHHQLNDALPKMPVATDILSTLPLPRTLHEHEAPALLDLLTINTRNHASTFNV